MGRWTKRRHQNKPWKWITAKYFSASQENSSFSAIGKTKNGKYLKVYKIFRAGKVPIIRHIKIKSAANPYAREDNKYFAWRRKELRIKSEKTKQICIFRKSYNEIDKTLLNLWLQKAG